MNDRRMPDQWATWVVRGNMVLAVAVMVWGGWVVMRSHLPAPEVPIRIFEGETQGPMRPDDGLPLAAVQPLGVYLDGIAQRDIFRDKGAEVAAANNLLPAAIGVLEQKFKLIGILVDGDPKAIVEDLQDNQTHFLSRGDSLGQVLLEEIRADKAIFVINDQRYEMSL